MIRPDLVEYICTRCGLCCQLLHAVISAEERAEMGRAHSVDPDLFAESVGEDQFRIRMPCMFQVQEGDRYRCRVHDQYRPELCRTYYCRVALELDHGYIDQDQASMLIHVSRHYKSAVLFNWSQASEEEQDFLKKVQHENLVHCAVEATARLPESVRKQVDAHQLVRYAELGADNATSRYDLNNPVAQLVLAEIFAQAEQGQLKLAAFLDPECLEPCCKVTAEAVMIAMALAIRDLFLKEADEDDQRP